MAIYIGKETAFSQPGGMQPYTRTITYPGGVNPNWQGGGGGGGGMNPAAMSAIQKAIAYYQEGGGFGKGAEAALERSRTKAVASGGQSLVSAGLAGTTMMAGLGKKFEEEVGMPTRARVEETRAGAISGLEMAKAQIIQGATEADRSRALQEYLAQLGAGGGATRGPTMQPTVQPVAQPTAGTKQPAYKFPSAPSLVSTMQEPQTFDPMTYGGTSEQGRKDIMSDLETRYPGISSW